MANMNKGSSSMEEKGERSLNFIEQIITDDIQTGKNGGRIHTRFPPEPNGYLHIGHAKAICLSYGLAEKFGGLYNLRFDDTNPLTEDVEYVDSIMEDVRWLGYDWEDRLFYASDYFEMLYEWAEKLIKKDKAYVCDLPAEEISRQRGTPTRPGTESPFRNRTIDENLDLFSRMRKGEFRNGEKVLRAKIDMASPNMHMRDPVMYRIIHAPHHRTGDKWCIYPTYDYAHGQSDSIEGITHSVCTLEFEVHRPLYDWFIRELEIFPSRQIEFARLNLSYTIMSKRKLLQLVRDGHVSGWNDPRMPTISGLRRRGYTPASIRYFADRIGVAKRNNVIDVALLEHSVREDLNKVAVRVMAVLNPLKIVITNYPGESEEVDAVINPEQPELGKRKVPFSRELFIEKEDFMEDPPKKFFRLAPGREIRLKYAYIIKCEKAIKDTNGEITELHCTYDPMTRSGMPDANRKVKSTIHWVSAHHAKEIEVRLFDRLFMKEEPEDSGPEGDFISGLNPDSLKITTGYITSGIEDARPLDKFQFERLGYFCVDPDSTADKKVFNRTVTLRDAWTRHGKASTEG
jgi:glutaminyl-tRNA synthetase